MTEMPIYTPKEPKQAPAPDGRRKVSLLLGIGTFLLPIIFAWFLLRKGHSVLARFIGFGWLGLFCITALGSNGSKTVEPSATSTPAVAPATPEETAAAAEKARREAEAAIERHPEQALTLTKIRGEKAGFDTVFETGGTIKNTSGFGIKDPVIKCDLMGPSGTKVGSVRETLYQIIPANGSKAFRELNMGFMGSTQVSSFNCSIVGASLEEQ